MVKIRLQNGESRKFARVEIGDDGTVFGYSREGEFPNDSYPLQGVFPPGSVLEIDINEEDSYDTSDGHQILGSGKYSFQDPIPGKD